LTKASPLSIRKIFAGLSTACFGVRALLVIAHV
jgi:hypothetical protein